VPKKWSALEEEKARWFLTEKLNDLAQRRVEIEQSIKDASQEMARFDQEVISVDFVRNALQQFRDVYDCLRPAQRRELFHLVLRRAAVSDRQFVLEINGDVPGLGMFVTGASRPGISNLLH
jgi:hypothetical protein